MRYLLFIVLLVAVVITAGCFSDDNNTLVTSSPAPPGSTITSIQTKFVPGDIIAKTASSTDLFFLILSYDATTDKYERASVNKKSDGSWYRNNDKSEFSDRIHMEKLYPATVGHVTTISPAPPSPTTSNFPPPAIMSIHGGNYISQTPGKSIVINYLDGSGFQPGASIKLRKSGYFDIPLNNVEVLSNSQISCISTLPIDTAAGPWDIIITNPDGQWGTLSRGVYVWGKPLITSISPKQGYLNSTIGLTITGQNFATPDYVCNSGECSSARVDIKKGDYHLHLSCLLASLNKITCMVPLSPHDQVGSWDVTVTNPGDLSATETNTFTTMNST